MADEPTLRLFGPQDDERCGEGCERKADIDIDGLTYCTPCLARLVALGNVFEEAITEARERTQQGET